SPSYYSSAFVFSFFFFSSRRRHTRFSRDLSSDVCSSDLTTRRASRRQAGSVAPWRKRRWSTARQGRRLRHPPDDVFALVGCSSRSEERRVGKQCRSRSSPYH